MYTKDINPKISERDFRFIRSIYITNGPFDNRNLTVNFIKIMKPYFKMRFIANWLGVSIRHLYRLLSDGFDVSKDLRLFYLINNIIYTDDYETFIKYCNFDKIIITGVNHD